MSEHGNYIGGAWRAVYDARPDSNPSDTTDVIGHYARADAGEARDAVSAAHDAFPAWSLATPQQRFDALDFAGSEILARREELGTLLSREEGKVLAEGIAEATRAGQIFKFFAGEALRYGGDRVPSVRPGVEVETAREPLGPVALITPWNFPLAIPAWKIAPALAFGNTVVFKPAELVPGCAWALTEILSRAGLPEGVFNLVMGSGAAIGPTLLDDPRIAGVSFTGSDSVGAGVRRAAASRGAKVQLEMGGKNPLVVLDDADLDAAVSAAVNGAFYSTGQRCTASSRLVVTDGIHDRFVEAMAERITTLRVDHALKDGTQIGPVVSEAQLKQDLDYLDIGKQEGAKLAAGGEPVQAGYDGYYLRPALFTDTRPDMRINREEIFGPVAGVIRVSGYEQALAVANDTRFGLCAGICTTSLRHASHFKRHVQAGVVTVNLPTAGLDYHVPFGGRKDSSYGGPEQGRHAVEFYSIMKTTYLAP